MSNEHNIVPLTFPGSGEKVRVVWLDGQPHWVAIDVCRELDIAKPRDAVASLDEGDAATTGVIDGLGREQETYVVNEAGLYQLIFQSRKAQAKVFKRWIFNEVIPTIRRTGSYESAHALEVRVKDMAARMDPSYRTIHAAWRRKEIPSKVIRAFAHNHGILMEAVGFPKVMTTSGEIDDANGVGKNRDLRRSNGTNRSKMYKAKFGRKPFQAVAWRADEFRIVNHVPRREANTIPGFHDRQITSDHFKAIDK